MDNPEPFAKNFEAREKRLGEKYNQILTVFNAPIREDQKAGIELVPGTWVKFMVVTPAVFTLEVRVARPQYWVLSRQTLEPRTGAQVDSRAYRPFLSVEESRVLLQAYSDEVGRTRSILDALVAQ